MSACAIILVGKALAKFIESGKTVGSFSFDKDSMFPKLGGKVPQFPKKYWGTVTVPEFLKSFWGTGIVPQFLISVLRNGHSSQIPQKCFGEREKFPSSSKVFWGTFWETLGSTGGIFGEQARHKLVIN